jgi:hypothetical protein
LKKTSSRKQTDRAINLKCCEGLTYAKLYESIDWLQSSL